MKLEGQKANISHIKPSYSKIDFDYNDTVYSPQDWYFSKQSNEQNKKNYFSKIKRFDPLTLNSFPRRDNNPIGVIKEAFKNNNNLKDKDESESPKKVWVEFYY